MEIFIPILVSFLLDDIKTTSTAERSLHDDSLQRLMKIGPQYPEEFRSIMAGQSILKTKLESAIKLGQSVKQKPVTASNPLPVKSVGVPVKPSITLKTNFSNYTG